MYTWILIMSSIGAAIGAFSAQNRDLTTMIIMALIGMAFSAPLGALFFALVSACQGGQRREMNDATGTNMMDFGTDRFQDRLANISLDWDEYRNAFPHYAVGDTDPVAKTLTGWKDASDIQYERDIKS